MRLEARKEECRQDEEVLKAQLTAGKHQDLKADLMRWAGQSVTLTIQTTPGQTPDMDYVFLGDPVLHTP